MSNGSEPPPGAPPDSPDSPPPEKPNAGGLRIAKKPYGPRLSRIDRALLLRTLEQTGSKSTAARRIGRDPDTLTEWLRLGRAGVRFYAQLTYDIERAMSAALHRLHAKVTVEALKDDVEPPRPALPPGSPPPPPAMSAAERARLGIDRGKLALAYLDRIDPDLAEQRWRGRRPVLTGEIAAGVENGGSGKKAAARVAFQLTWAEDGSDLDIPGPPLGAQRLLDAASFHAAKPAGGNGGGNGDDPDE